MASASRSVWEYLCSTVDRARLTNCTIRPFCDSTAEMPTGLASVCISVCLFGSKLASEHALLSASFMFFLDIQCGVQSRTTVCVFFFFFVS